jgi:hypothetical protein
MRRVVEWAALAGVLALAACDVAGPNDRARLSILLTDAPGDVESVWIEIEQIFMIGEEKGEIEVPGELGGLIKLTDLLDQTRELAADVPFEPDVFRELRLVLGDVVLVSKQGAVYATPGATLPAGVPSGNVQTLQCPSCAQSGLKIKVQGGVPELEEGDDAVLLLDFDVSQSFGHRAGGSGRWIMHPVVLATWVEAPPSAIRGTAAIQLNPQGQPAFTVPQCPAGTARSITDFIPKATAATLKDASNNAIVRTGTVAANGTFSISPVDPDGYTMGFNETLLGNMKLVWTATVTPAQVTVRAGADVTGVAYTLTGASCVANP